MGSWARTARASRPSARSWPAPLQPDAGDSSSAAGAVRYRSPRQALDDGVTLIAQEPAARADALRVENVFLGVEPAWRGVVDRRRLRARFAALNERTGFDLPADARIRDLRAADQQRVEVMRALARDAEPRRDGRAHRRRSPRTRPRSCSTIVRLPAAAGHHGRLRLPLARGGALGRGHGQRPARRRARPHRPRAERERRVARRRRCSGARSSWRSPRRRTRRADAPVVLSARALTRGRRRRRRLLRRPGRRDRRPRRVSSAAAAREIAQADLRRRPHGPAARCCSTGGPLRVRSPRDAIRHGIALLPESRKDQGLMMRRSIAENVALPHLARPSSRAA